MLTVAGITLTDADFDITLYSGTPIWTGKGPKIDKDTSQSAGHWKRGLDVDTWVLVIAPRRTDPITGADFPDKIADTPWIEAARQGVFDGADVQIDRAYFAPGFAVPYRPVQSPVGVITVFAGRVAEVDTTDSLVVLTINDYRELFTEMMPRDLYAASCLNTLFGQGCKLIEANYETPGVTDSGSNRGLIIADADMTAPGSGTFALGKIRMTSGLNAGFRRTVSSWTAPRTFGLLNPFPFAIEIGDTFMAYPGCNKTIDACNAFGNYPNFRGAPDIPEASTAL